MPAKKKTIIKKGVAKITKDITKKEWDQEGAIKEVDKMMREWEEIKFDKIGVDNDPGIDVPLHAKGGAWKWNFQEQDAFDEGTVCGYESAASDFKIVNRITWVLTAVNVGILISLVIKNV